MTDMIITGIIDGPLPGGLPKALELTALVGIADLSIYGISNVNNGGASPGVPIFALSGSAIAGEKIYVSTEVIQFNEFFGFDPDFTSSVLNINGDDAMELYKNGTVIDVFGVVGVDGTGELWEHLDGWAYRVDGATPNGGVFDIANWIFSGVDSLDNATSNATAPLPFPIGAFDIGTGGGDDTGMGGGGDEFVLISAVQGNGATQGSNAVGTTNNNDASPLLGQIVTIEAIVVGDFQNGDADTARTLGGFFLQEEDADADGDATTSEGLFVFDNNFGTDVNIGDKVRVTGTVQEFFGATQLSMISGVTVVSSGNALPTAATISLPAEDVSLTQSGQFQADLEAYEGMLVRFEDTLTITEQFQLDRFNEIRLFATEGFEQTGPNGFTLTGERPFQFTQYNTPDAAGFAAYRAETAARGIIYDDGQNQQNLPPALLDGFAPYSTATAPSMGDTVTGLTGVLDYSWAGNAASQATWRVRATEDGQNSFVDTNPRPAPTAHVDGDIKIAAFNVLNFFTTLDVFPDTTGDNVGPALNLEPRGADASPQQALPGTAATAEYDRQLEKLVTAILGLDADIIGLNEIENDFLSGGTAPGNQANQQGGLTAIETLVAALNTAIGAAVWDWVDPGTEFIGADAIAVGLIYRSDKVEIAGGTTPAILTDAGVAPELLAQSTVGGIFDGVNTSRAPLAATFATLSDGDTVTIAVNHFKSKGGVGTGADADQGDGAGAWTNQRLLAAQALDAWLKTNPTGSDTPNIMLLGDFNSYGAEGTIDYLTDVAGFVDVVAEFVEAGYSFIFDALLGTLDYAFASLDLFISIVDAIEWNINADEADALDYNLEFGRDPAMFDGDLPYRSSDHDPIVVGLSFLQADQPLTVNIYDGASYQGSIDPTGALEVEHLSTLTLSGAEIAAFANGKLYVTSTVGLQIVDISDVANPVLQETIDFTTLGFATTDISSVASNGMLIAVALPASPKTDNGRVVFLNLDGTLIGSVEVGSLPDNVTFTPDGKRLLVANEGEPDEGYVNDPLGSVSIIDISDDMTQFTVETLDFVLPVANLEALARSAGVRVFEGVAVANDLEPEYIAVSPDGLTAFVTLQENNAVVIIDLTTNTISDVVPLGGKDFANLFADFSDRDGGMNLTTGNPVIGQFMPDAIASYVAGDGATYFVIANEGDDRDDFLVVEETIRLGNAAYDLDDTLFPNEAALKASAALGRLNVVNAPLLNGDLDGDGDIDQILTYGARSFSILNADGVMVFDSGDALERIVAEQFPALFDDGRSDNKGPEPEGITVATIGDRAYAFVGLERSNMTMVFDVTDPADVTFVTGITNAGDISPEGLLVIKAEDSPTGEAIFVVANEVSNTISLFGVEEAEENFTLQLLHFSDAEAGLLAGDTAPLLAALVDGYDDTYANTLILAGGDNFIPGPFLAAGTDASVAATHTKGNNPGAADIEIHNRIGVEASTIGNHEFDLGTNAFSDAIGDAAFPYLSVNLDFSADSGISSRYQETVGVGGLEDVSTMARKIVPSAVVTKGGEKIGLVGATTQIVERISSTGNVEVKGFAGDGAETNDMVLLAAQLQPVIDDLIAQGVNKIILMAHLQQIALEQELATLLTGVDIILSAGSNTRLGDANDTAVAFPGHEANFAGTYPIVTAGADGKTTLIVNTDNEFTYLGRLVVEFDANGDIVLDALDDTINGAIAATAENVAIAWNDLDGDLSDTAFAAGTKGAAVAQITEAVDAVIAAKDGQVWGFTNVYLEGERNQVRNQETNLGNITADANLSALSAALGGNGVFASLKNGGGIRAQIGAVDVGTGDRTPPIANPDAGKPAGAISQLDIENALRFNNGLMALDTDTAGLKAILEHGIAVLGGQGRYPQIGGFSFSYDPDLAAGARVQNVAIIDADGNFVAPVIVNGQVSPNAPATITMVTLNFLANGGDGYPFKAVGGNFRYLLNDGTLSAPVDEALSFTAAGVVPLNILGEQQAMAEHVAAVYGTPATAYDVADTGAANDTRIQDLNVVADDTVIPTPVSDIFTLELLHFTDQEAATSAIENAPNLSAVLNALRAQDLGNDGIDDNSITLSAGDSFIPSPFFDASQALYGSKGIADIQIQNELGVQAIALGNHEIDLGPAVLADLIDGSAPGSILGADFQGALYPYLSSNLNFSTNPDLAALQVAGGGAPQANTVTSSVVLTVDSEQTGTTELIGVVGATTPTLARISSPGNVGILPTPFDGVPTAQQLDALAAIIQAEVDELLAANPTMNKVILLAHMQVLNIEVQLASRLSDVDVIVAGGSNTRLFDDNDRARDGDSDQGQYPIFATDKDGNPIAIVNTDGSYKYVGRLVVDFDANGHIIPASYDADVSGAYATDAQGVADLGAQALVDPEIQQIVNEIETQIIATQSNVFGYSSVYLNGNRSGIDTPTDLDGVRTQETNLGTLTALANLDYAQQFDSSVMVSIKNGGGIRASIGEIVVPPGGTAPGRFANSELVDGDGNVIKPANAISQNDIANALSFNNGLSLITMTATSLVAALEHSVAQLPTAGGRFGHFAGVEFSFDPALPVGARVMQADLVNEFGGVISPLVRNGVLVADAALEIRVVTLNFLAGGGDGFAFNGTGRVDLYDLNGDAINDGTFDGVATFAENGTEQDAFAEYLAATHGTADAAYDVADTGRDSDLNSTNLAFARQTVFEDTAGTSAVDRITRTFDGADVLREVVIENDNGVIVTREFDADGVVRMRTISDVADVLRNVTAVVVFDANGDRTFDRTERDTGIVIERDYVGGLLEQVTETDTKDIAGFAVKLRTFDAGVITANSITFDRDTAGRSTLLETYVAGDLSSSLTTFLDGATRLITYDAGVFAFERQINADGTQKVKGGAGDDVIAGGAFNDKLSGGAGADTFVFAGNFGRDRVTDFDVAGDDLLDLTDFGITDLDSLLDTATLTQRGSTLRIDLDADATITLRNVLLADLTDADFFNFGSILL